MLSDKNKQQILKQKSIDGLGKSIKKLADNNPDDVKFEKLQGQFELLSSIEAVITGAIQKDIDRTNEKVRSFDEKGSSKNPHINLKDIMLYPIH